MPKQVVVEKGKDFPTSGAGWLGTKYARVGWNKETGTVDIATVDPGGKLGALQSDGTVEPIDAVIPGWFVELDRKGVNDLIRALRKARDDAFGRDE